MLLFKPISGANGSYSCNVLVGWKAAPWLAGASFSLFVDLVFIFAVYFG